MVKKWIVAGSIFVLIGVLAACSSLPIPGITSASANSGNSANSGQGAGANQNGQRGNQFDPATMPVEQKLAIGILKLEDTSMKVTPDQAKILLPLWQALKSLSTNNNTTTDEINALFTQMKDTLTPDQVTAIQKMTWQQSDLQALAQQYGIQFAQGGFGGTPNPQRETQIAQFRASNGNAGGGGGFFGPGGGGPGGFGGGGGGNNGTTRPTQSPQQQARRQLGGLNRIFADAVIKLLQQKAGG